MTGAELQAARELLSKTTQGKWEAVGMGSEGYNIYVDFGKPMREQLVRGPIAEVRRGATWQELRVNAEFMAQAHDLVPRLIGEVERLREKLKLLRRHVDDPAYSVRMLQRQIDEALYGKCTCAKSDWDSLSCPQHGLDAVKDGDTA
jgi:hypothetical protein